MRTFEHLNNMKMESITVPISTVKANPNNPRLIKDDKFKKFFEI